MPSSEASSATSTARPTTLAQPSLTAAWQPFTWGGVAAFARASLARVLALEAVFAALAVGAVILVLVRGWFPTVHEAIRHLPEQGTIQNRELQTPLQEATLLAESSWLAFIADPANTRRASSAADVRVVFQKRQLVLSSLLGHSVVRYPDHTAIQFNRPECEPAWGAWEPFLLLFAALAVFATLIVLWAGLASVYALGVWLLGYFGDRAAGYPACWRLASAALMPGSLIMSVGIALYGLGWLNLVQLAAIGVLHIMTGWIYLAASPWQLPPAPHIASPANPFSGSVPAPSESAAPQAPTPSAPAGADPPSQTA